MKEFHYKAIDYILDHTKTNGLYWEVLETYKTSILYHLLEGKTLTEKDFMQEASDALYEWDI